MRRNQKCFAQRNGRLNLLKRPQEYIWNDLIELYDGKLSYVYCFEAPAECVDDTLDGMTTKEDCDKAAHSLDTLMDKYL